jgi:hypothetical protein
MTFFFFFRVSAFETFCLFEIMFYLFSSNIYKAKDISDEDKIRQILFSVLDNFSNICSDTG